MGTNTPAIQNDSSPRHNDSPRLSTRKKPIDAWCDDGSVSRAEPPWLRDRRLKLQGWNAKKKTNPFDATSSSSSSSANMYKNPFEAPPPPTASSYNNNPFDSPMRPTISNPFESSTNPFDSSTEGGSSVRKSPKRNFRPVVETPSVEDSSIDVSKKDASVAVDSLDRFLDTTDETVEESFDSAHNPRHLERSTPSALADESSQETAPSEKAMRAAEQLRRSFNQPRTPPPMRSSPPGASTTSARMRALSTPTIPEEENTPKPMRPIVTPPSHRIQPPVSQRTPRTPEHFPNEPIRPPVSQRTPRTPEHFPSMQDLTGISPTPSYLEPMVPIRRKPSKPVDLDVSLESSAASGQRQQWNAYNEIPSLLPARSNSESVVSESRGDAVGESRSESSNSRLALHDLCDEARAKDDVAWHNALYLLSVQPELCKELENQCQMNPLHVCCLTSAPVWMTRALLYTRSEQCQEMDVGGRLPLHLCVATNADVDTMQLLVQENPSSVSHKDKRGFTPLHLLLKNDQITLTLEHLRIMLGQTIGQEATESRPKPIHIRKKEHLDASLSELEALHKKQEEHHENMFLDYPDDVQQTLGKIVQWKRRQITKGNMQRNDIAYDYVSPASIQTPGGKLLPLHLLVRRTPNSPPTTIIHSRPPGSTLDMCRILIHAYPQALVTRDAGGKTPLLTAMLQTDSLPSEEVVETLLGLRTPQPLDISPAKFPANDTHQLPLHVAAEEMTSNYELLATICEAYPEGIEKQDLRGRTPLHLALANYRSTPVDEALLELLTNKHVAKTRDFDGNRPLDWVLEHPTCLLQRDDSLVFQQFLDDSIGPPKSWRETDDLVRQLQYLPPWLRRQACAAKYVQKALLDQLTMPFNTFGVLLWGCVLVALLVMLRLLLVEQKPGHVLTVYILASYLLGQQLLRCMLALFRGEFYRLCLSNPWAYVHLASGTLAIVAAHTVDSEAAAFKDTLSTFDFAHQEALIDSLGAFATAGLWLSVVGFLVEWWCGMAVAFGSAIRVVQVLFWPIVVATMGIVAAAQILYTVEDCSGDICPLSDVYSAIYWTILGEPILTDDLSLSRSGMILLIAFSILALWWLLSVLVLAVSESQSMDRHQIALQWYWEPKVAMVWTRTIQPKLVDEPSVLQLYCNRMEELWHILIMSIKGDDYRRREIHWYSCLLRPCMRFFTPLLAMLIIPIWILLGAATLGLLWPPQVRRWIFATTILSKPKTNAIEDRITGSKLSQLKGEWHKFQETSMERNGHLQQDISQIKDILIRAMLEDEKLSS